VLSAQSGDGPAAARAQADPFLQQADAALSAGSSTSAASLLDSAIQLSPDYSECLYLRARIELSDRASTRAAIEDIRASLKNASWSRTDPDAVRQSLAGVLLRTGALGEAQALLEALCARHPEDAGDLLLLARLFARAGNDAGEQRILADAAARFPLRDEFRLLASALLERKGQRQAAREVIATGMKVHPDSLPLLLATARLSPTASLRRAAVDRYTAAGGADPLAAVIGLESAQSNTGKYLDLFLSQGGLGRQDLVERVTSAVGGTAALSRTLSAALSAYSGTRDLDPDNDGWVERWTFEKGVPTGWVRDPVRDGVPQYSAQFVGGAPSTLSCRPPSGALVTLRFSSYPFIASADTAPGLRLFPVPYTQQCVFLLPRRVSAPEGLAPRISARIAVPTVGLLEKGAYRREEYAADGVTLRRMTELSHGVPVYGEEDTNGDGVIDHRMWYANGVPVRGQRSPTGDGIFSIAETWKEGKLASEDFDIDNDGIVDYREQYGAQPMKLWDYNGDGRMDSREYPAAGGAVVREISSAGNGVFDLRVVWRGSRIVQVLKSGSPLGVTADAKRGVTWIGQPAPAAAIVDPSRPDGTQLLGGREYLVFHYGGITYAEDVR
jgi:tetratricopeptide (TPR) repeat protein